MSNIPTREYNCLLGYSDENAEIIYKSVFNKDFSWVFQFPLLQLKHNLAFKRMRDNSETNDWKVYCLEDETDLNILSEMSNTKVRKFEFKKMDKGLWL